MAEKKSYIYEIIVDTQKGTAKINGTAVALDKLEGKLKAVSREATTVGKNMGQVTDKTGLAGAAVVELGRTISDSNYGLTAMANNMSQLSTLMITLIATTGGVKKGFQAMWTAIKGPLGIILAIQIVITLMEKFAMGAKDAKDQIQESVNLLDSQLAINTELIKQSGEVLDKESELYQIRKSLLELKLVDLEMQKMALQNEVEMMIVEAQRLSFWESVKGVKAGIDGEEQASIDALDTKINNLNLTILKTRAILEDGLLGTGGSSGKGQKGAKEKKATILTQAERDAFAFEELSNEMQLEADRLRFKSETGLAEIELERNKQEELLELQTRHADLTREVDKLVLDQKMQMFEAIGGGLQSLGYLLGEATSEGKAIAAAGALIDTYAAITGILKNTARTPAGGIPGFAIAQAVAAGLFGFAQVKKIYSVDVPNGKGSGGAVGGVPSEVPIQQPDFNIVGVARQNQLRETIDGALGRPIRAYVTTRDIRSGEELDRNIVRGASVG